jgi:hypothetical protein
MDKIATAEDIQAELRTLWTMTEGSNPSRKKLAKALGVLAVRVGSFWGDEGPSKSPEDRRRDELESRFKMRIREISKALNDVGVLLEVSSLKLRELGRGDNSPEMKKLQKSFEEISISLESNTGGKLDDFEKEFDLWRNSH